MSMSIDTEGRVVHVLLAEDNPTDVLLTREALADAKLRIHLHVVEDGVEALEFLHKEGKYGDVPNPDIILLDLNLPNMNGHEALTAIKSDDRLKHIPVVILTTSEDEADVQESYHSGANCYITKPVNFDQFRSVVKTIETFWFTIVTLPHEESQNE